MTHLDRSINQQNMNSILQTHFNNINILASSIQSSQELITRMQRENNITNTIFDSIFNDDDMNTTTPTRRQRRNPNRNNNDRDANASNRQHNNDFTYYFTFDTLGSSTNSTNLYTHDISFEILLITEGNKNIVNGDVSQNANHYHLYEISNFDLIQNPINDVCPITRERFDSASENILMIKNCKHIFNKSALNIWLEGNNSCPCWRGRIG